MKKNIAVEQVSIMLDATLTKDERYDTYSDYKKKEHKIPGIFRDWIH